MIKTVGSKIVKCQKNSDCLICKFTIFKGDYYFLKNYIKENELFATYEKYHLHCGYTLSDLTKEEKQIIENGLTIKNSYSNKSEKQVMKEIKDNLITLERNNKLSFVRVVTAKLFFGKKAYWIGKFGCSDYIIFLPNKTLFLEIKKPLTNFLNNSQKNFKKRINLLGYEYYIINNIIDYHKLINKYIIN